MSYYSYRSSNQVIRPDYSVNDVIQSSQSLAVSLTDVKQALGFYTTDTSQDTYLTDLIVASEDIASNYIGSPISSVTRTDYYSRFANKMELSVRFIEDTPNYMVRYYDINRARATWGSGNYFIDTTVRYPMICRISGVQFPEVSQEFTNPVSITYDAGIPAELVDQPVFRRALIGIVFELYKNRGMTTNLSVNHLPLNALRLLDHVRKVVL